MPKKAKTKKPGTNTEKKICDAALKLAARRGWNSVTLEDIARAATLSPAQVKKNFPDTASILPALVRQTNAKTADALGKAGPHGAAHDRLFEVMMARFDILQENRRAILNIMADIRRDPRPLRFLLPAETEAMRRMLTLARLTPEGPGEPLAVAGLLGVYGFALCTWQRDSSPDMSKTMAALDKALRQAGKLAEILFRRLK